MGIQTFKTQFGGKEITIETGRYAQNTNASCTLRMGDTMVLVTAVMSSQVRGDMSFFPLMVDYEEKLYAAGRIKGSRFIKREGRPTDEAVLVSRFIDRAIRPLFNNAIRNDIQVIVTALSFDGENDPDILGLIGASCVLNMSDIPWNGPIGAIRVSKIGEEWIFNPTYEQRKEAEFELDLAGNTEKVIMIEARANQTEDSVLAEAFKKGRNELTSILTLQEEIRTAIGKEKIEIIDSTSEEAIAAKKEKDDIEEMSKTFLVPRIQELFFGAPQATKRERGVAKNQLKKELTEYLTEQGLEEAKIKIGTSVIYDFLQYETSRMILEEGKRIDGREIEEIRPLTVETGVVPRVHGCGHFSRGETQSLSICTLGGPGDKQILDGMETVTEVGYMHHYNFLPFSVGEARPLRGTGRREVGHGALAEKALIPVLPLKEDFPYTIRVVSETLNSNGSSSMASTCGSTLALMDAGVPITAPVAGVAIGLASIGDKWKVITDIQDLEDGVGGMDFKVTGTEKGVTAIQMDTKTDGLTQEIIEEALRQGTQGRINILKQIKEVIAQPKEELSEFAPRIMSIKIDPDKIRVVVGGGGKTINEIIEKTGVQNIDIEQDGLVMITSIGSEPAKMAYDWINNLTREITIGEEFEGEVTRVMDFGIIVSFLPGRDGMVHISEMAPWRVANVEDIAKMGDTVKVKVMSTEEGKTSLSMKQAEGNEYTEEMKQKASQAPAGRPGGNSRPNRRPPMRRKHD